MKSSRMKEPVVTSQLAIEHGLTEEEFEKIKGYLGRVPTFTELGVYSVMWSEHCSYKNSIKILKTLPNTGPQLLVGAGEENAGLVDIGDGMACAFKIESHNHPSAVEPYQGAATGVGGIHRDIFTMGARPVASLNSLRFGSLENPRVRFLLEGVVHGISDYGNSFGVPTVAGDVFFDPSYEGNPLVNAMSVGLVEAGKTASAAAPGPGNPVLIVGASTGRDGIHGATFASEEISEESESKRPSVQVGDPFMEKLLLEATLEAIATGAIAGIQDMGAAGISCSSSEMSAKSKTGMRINLDNAPQRESGMTAYEMLLSESQERMLIVAHKGREQEIQAVFDKWDVSCEIIGEVTDTGKVEYWMHGELKASIPADSLVLGGGAPVYEREVKKPAYIDQKHAFDLSRIPDEKSPETALRKLLKSPNIASKRWIYEQYDHMVRTNTAVGPGASNAGVIRIKGTNKALVVKTDCNGRYVYLNPRKGGQIAVAEAARNVVCSGAKPLAITNCLNFGNPYKPEVYWVFKEAVGGMGDACRLLQTPVTGGNVSFYNENPKGAVFPTPTIGMLGLIDDITTQLMTPGFKKSENVVVYLGAPRKGLGGSEYLATVQGLTEGDAPEFDLNYEAVFQTFLLDVIRSGLVASAHDISDGGLLSCLAEKCIFSGFGATISTEALMEYSKTTKQECLFSEAQSGVVVSCTAEQLDAIKAKTLAIGSIGCILLGKVSGTRLEVDDDIKIETSEMLSIYENAIPDRMKQTVS
ncbi:MAG: phosphoribosylformylglycinamidine synthase subunit PurL [Balneolales bacterium]|nr:phosphoribosylformylglycinamidine synthase subunit PurL [Balneolales bacterium]